MYVSSYYYMSRVVILVYVYVYVYVYVCVCVCVCLGARRCGKRV
jgi:hypothetical protein